MLQSKLLGKPKNPYATLAIKCKNCSSKTEGGKIIKVEAHPIPEHPRPRRVKGRAVLVGDAAGYVTKCSGEGIYFAAKSGRMCAEAIVEKEHSDLDRKRLSLAHGSYKDGA